MENTTYDLTQAKTPDLEITPQIKEGILETLKQLGAPTHTLGYGYIKTALRLILETPGYLKGVTQSLYPTVATIYSTTPSRVERSIRHTIEVIFDRNTPEMLEGFFGPTDLRKGKLCNSEFLARVAEDIRIKEGICYSDDVRGV